MTEAVSKWLNTKYVRYIIIVCLAIMATISVFQGVRNAINVSQDFQWDASRALIEGIDPYELSLHPETKYQSEGLTQFYDLFTSAGLQQKMEANQFPSLLYLLAPFAIIPPLTARYVWILANLIFTAGIICLLRKTFFKELPLFNSAVIMLLMLAGTPYRNQLGVGQHTIFSFFFFMLAVWLDEVKPEGNRIGISICMFVSYFKYTLTAPLVLYLLYRKRYREFIISVAGHILLTIVAAISLNKSVIYMLIAPLKVSKALSAEGGLDLGALLNGSSLSFVIGGAVAVLLVVITVKMEKNREYLLFPLLLLWSLIITYHRTYDFFVLSVVYMMFSENYKNDFSEREYKITYVMYWIMLFAVFFGLRVFNENDISRIVVGLIYYVFTIMITVIAVNSVRTGKARSNNG